MDAFEQHVIDRFGQSIQGWTSDGGRESVGDIYAISFLVLCDEEDECKPQAYLSYNTESYWQRQVSRASSAAEARWNIAFWPQDFKAIVATATGERYVDPDPIGVSLRDRWLRRLDLSPADADGQAATDGCGVMLALCARVARRLHEQGLIAAAFGRSIPIIIHELDYDDDAVEQTRKANPPEVLPDFDAWVRTWLPPGRPRATVWPEARPGQWDREQLLELVERLLNGEGSGRERDAWLEILQRNVPHPRVKELFYGARETLTAAAILDRALSYKAILL